MTPTQFAEQNTVMRKPPNMPECVDIHAFNNGVQIVTAWRPSPAELTKINLGQPVYLVLWGPTMQPALVTADSPFVEPSPALPL